MRFIARHLCPVLTLFTLGFLTASAAQEAPSSSARLQKVIRDVVGKDGTEFIGLGSWISNTNYCDPLKAVKPSDHDIRLVLPPSLRKPPTDPAAYAAWEQQVLARWKQSRDALFWGIREEFGKDADKILRNTNLYAPVEIMRTVEDPEMAREFFIKAQQVPRLDYRDAVTETTRADFIEGMYGKGTEAYTQKYESQAGRVFYKQGKEVYAGRPDLIHLGEMEGKGLLYTGQNPAGTGNTARQWIEHCDDAIDHGKPSSVAKYLERLEQDLSKGRDLCRAGSNSNLSAELKSLAAQLRANNNSLAGSEAAVRSLLRQAKLEATLLARFQYAGALQKKVLTAALQGLALGNDLGKALKSAIATGGEAVFEHIGTIFTAGIMAYETKQAYDNRDPVAGWTALSPTFATLGTTLLMEMTKAVIEGSRDLGYAMAAGQQNAFDLLDGIYTARGRADVAGTQYTIDQLVDTFRTEPGLRSFVWNRAQEAANRGLGQAGWVHDLGSAQAIFDRCYPVILRAWRAKREQLELELQYLYDRIATERCTLQYDPVPAALPAGGGEVIVTVSYRDGEAGGGAAFEMAGGKPPWNENYADMPAMLARAKEIIKRLVHPNTQVFGNVYNKWSDGGLGASEDPTQRYRFTKPGTYTVTLTQEIRVGATNQAYGTLLDRKDIKRQISVDVLVPGEQEKPKPPPSTGVWVLTERSNNKREWNAGYDVKRLVEVQGSTADIRAYKQDGTIYEHVRCSWTVPPDTLVPGQELVIRTSVAIVSHNVPPTSKPWTPFVSVWWDPSTEEHQLVAAPDQPVTQDVRLKIGSGLPNQTKKLHIQSMLQSWGYDDMYTYTFKAPGQ